MKKNRGFTLVELLAVIVILAVILVIAIPNVMKVIDKAKLDAYKRNESMLISAGRNYVASYAENIPISIGSTTKVNISDLQTKDLLKDIKDPKSNTSCSGYVLITKISNSEYNYSPYIECGTNYYTEDYIKNGLILRLDGYDAPVSNMWKDKSGTNSDAVGDFSGTTSGYYDAVNKAYVFDGIDDTLTISNNIAFTNMTMELTYSVISANQSLDKYLGNVTSYFTGFHSVGSGIYTSVDVANIHYSAIPEQLNVKKLLSTTFDGSKTIFYVDSIKNGERANNVTVKNLNGLKIGSSNNQYSNINVYSVRIYNRSLSLEEIQYNYNIDKKRFGL
jgi:type IV pilus assembly protein PilA